MSHFLLIAIVPTDGDVKAHIDRMIAPYSEQREVEPHQEKCWCVDSKALREVAEIIHPKIEARRTGFREAHIDKAAVKFWHFSDEAEKLWKEYIADILAEQKALRESHPDREKADPECEDCHGKGENTTTGNPEGYWDWYAIGGRWTGFLTDYDASKDADNFEVCFLCHGSGKRPDMEVMDGCNGCSGTGKKMMFPTKLKQIGNIAPTLDYLTRLKADTEKNVPYALVTPDGEWHARGKMLMFGMSNEEVNENDWQQRVVSLVADNQNTRAVVVDCHT